jgi:AAA domain/IclR helix-turn-helix domain
MRENYAESRLDGADIPPPDEPFDPYDHPRPNHHGRVTLLPTAIGPSRGRGLRERVVNRAGLHALPKPRPLIENTLDVGTVALLAGYYGTLKSFVALDWSCCIATGFAWHARPVDAAGRVLYVAAEGAYGINQRITAWERYRHTTVPADHLDVLPTGVNLGSAADVAELSELVTAGRYRFVVLDTLAKAMAGMDENSAKDMGIAVAALYAIRAATAEGTVLVVHHSGKDRTTIRGSSALEAGVDTVHTTEGDAKALMLTRTKRKDGPCEDVVSLAFESVEGTESGIVSSHLGVRQSGRGDALLSHLLSHFSETGATGTQLAETSGMPKATMHRALNDLLSRGAIRNAGTRTRPRYEVVR